MKIVAGIDVGGTFTKIGLVDETGNIIAQTKINTKHNDGYEAWLSSISNAINTLAEGNTIAAVGIGAPNANYFEQIIENAPNLPYKGVLHLKKDLENRLDTTVLMDNDANLAAYGEWNFGLAKGMKDFVVITLGTGLGSGIVSNGKMLYGFNGAAGEVGHSIISPKGRVCNCGRTGCLETYVSATGIVKTAIEKGLNISSAQQLYELASQGNDWAKLCFEETGAILGLALSNVAAILSPEVIILSGGLASSGDYILQPTKRSFQDNLLFTLHNKCDLKLSALHENEAAIKGAAALALRAII